MKIWSEKEIKEFEDFCLSNFKARLRIIAGVNKLYFYSLIYNDFRRDIAGYICIHKFYDSFDFDGLCVVLNFED